MQNKFSHFKTITIINYEQIIQYALVLLASTYLVSCVFNKKFKTAQDEAERLSGEI